MNRGIFISFVLMLLVHSAVFAQLGYAKDSLQIKVYTQIDYKNSKPVKIFVRKVFCNYCTDYQKKVIGEEAIRRSYLEQFNPEHVSKNGHTRLALYIRVSKEDFNKLKEEDNK